MVGSSIGGVERRRLAIEEAVGLRVPEAARKMGGRIIDGVKEGNHDKAWGIEKLCKIPSGDVGGLFNFTQPQPNGDPDGQKGG